MIYSQKNKYDFTGTFLDDYVKINNHSIKLPYPSMAIAQNYLAAYSVSATLNIDDHNIIQELENAPLCPG